MQIETFYSDGTGDECSPNGLERGWYWGACWPGCLYDVGPIGPFDSQAEAQQDAQRTMIEAE